MAAGVPRAACPLPPRGLENGLSIESLPRAFRPLLVLRLRPQTMDEGIRTNFSVLYTIRRI